jgi:pimeloyl-ACP methyl ester carboxylesterase
MDRFTRAGLTFPVRDGGPQDGEAVVLLHGWPQNPSAFDAVVPLLQPSGLRTLVPTQRGYGAEARPSDRKAYRTEETVADVLALLDAAGLPQAHVVGHDWGGAQGWALAAGHPERVLSLTVLSTPHPAAMMAALVSGGQALRSWYMGLFQLPVVPELLVSRVLRRFLTQSHLPEPYLTSYCRTMAEPGALTGSLNWYRGLPFSVRPPVGPVRVPTTYVWGRGDPALGRAAAEATAAHVEGPYRFVELDAGHWLPETRPQDVAEAVLARVGR